MVLGMREQKLQNHGHGEDYLYRVSVVSTNESTISGKRVYRISRWEMTYANRTVIGSRDTKGELIGTVYSTSRNGHIEGIRNADGFWYNYLDIS